MSLPDALFEHHHRNVSGGAARAAVFGVSDGLLTNVALVIGSAGASSAQGLVRTAGLLGLVGGALSMAAGEYISMQAQRELLERELELERVEIERRPENERRELAHIYRSRGVDPKMADDLATEMMRDPELALETHAREELGIHPGQLGSPIQAAVASFASFAIGAFMPLAPWFFARGTGAVIASLILATISATAVGWALSVFTGRSAVRSAMRQLLFAGILALGTYLLGKAVGISVV
jgi:VIT1/CCC1 family predicted Fe2+/Mn2+ transporter